MLTISGSSGSGRSGVSFIGSVVDCSGGSVLSSGADTEDDCSVVEETGGSVFGGSTVDDGTEDSGLIDDDFEDFSELEEDFGILAVEVVEVVEVIETGASAVDVLSETELAGSLTVVDETGGSLSSDDCGTLDDSLEEISGCVELFSEFSDKTEGSIFASTDAEKPDCGDKEL